MSDYKDLLNENDNQQPKLQSFEIGYDYNHENNINYGDLRHRKKASNKNTKETSCIEHFFNNCRDFYYYSNRILGSLYILIGYLVSFIFNSIVWGILFVVFISNENNIQFCESLLTLGKVISIVMFSSCGIVLILGIFAINNKLNSSKMIADTNTNKSCSLLEIILWIINLLLFSIFIAIQWIYFGIKWGMCGDYGNLVIGFIVANYIILLIIIVILIVLFYYWMNEKENKQIKQELNESNLLIE